MRLTGVGNRDLFAGCSQASQAEAKVVGLSAGCIFQEVELRGVIAHKAIDEGDNAYHRNKIRCRSRTSPEAARGVVAARSRTGLL